jgi:hypothetical protein
MRPDAGLSAAGEAPAPGIPAPICNERKSILFMWTEKNRSVNVMKTKTAPPLAVLSNRNVSAAGP